MECDSMSRSELEAHLTRLRRRYEDLEETMTFNFANSTAHIGGGQVRKDVDMLNKLKEEINRIESILNE